MYGHHHLDFLKVILEALQIEPVSFVKEELGGSVGTNSPQRPEALARGMHGGISAKNQYERIPPYWNWRKNNSLVTQKVAFRLR